MTSTDLRVGVLLSAQRALLGSIGIAVRKIMCHWTEHEIQVRVVFGSEIAEENAEAMADAETETETEMMADFPSHKVSKVDPTVKTIRT